jgi:hypothetical protein
MAPFTLPGNEQRTGLFLAKARRQSAAVRPEKIGEELQ